MMGHCIVIKNIILHAYNCTCKYICVVNRGKVATTRVMIPKAKAGATKHSEGNLLLGEGSGCQFHPYESSSHHLFHSWGQKVGGVEGVGAGVGVPTLSVLLETLHWQWNEYGSRG